MTIDGVPQRHGSSVVTYLFDTEVWRKVFVPGLHNALGLFWPLVVFAALAGTTAIVHAQPPAPSSG